MSNVKNTDDLRELLIDEMISVKEGRSQPSRATAISKLATNVVNLLDLDMKAASLRMKVGADAEKTKQVGIDSVKLVS